jgi:hypothetical protein
METFLTLSLALGGIATGIGAIWTAVVTRRLVRSTEHGIAEQSRSLAEQNERARLNLEVDMLIRLEDNFNGPRLLEMRRRVAKHVMDNFIVDGELLEVRHLNMAAVQVNNFFEGLGYLQRIGALQAESVWQKFGGMTIGYWTIYEPFTRKLREEHQDTTLSEEFERLYRVVSDLDRKRGIGPFTKEQLLWFVKHESTVGQEEPTTDEGPTAPE